MLLWIKKFLYFWTLQDERKLQWLSYEQLIIQQDTPFNQLSNLINNHYNVFFTPAFWFLDDSVFSSVEHDIVLEIYDPTQNEIMNLNVMRETTDRPDNEVFNYTSLFDTEKTLHMLSQNFVSE